MDTLVVALHGFLGTPEDWTSVQSFSKNSRWICLDYYHHQTLNPGVELSAWGANFCQWIKPYAQKYQVLVVGYSQGGRLALHAWHANQNSNFQLPLKFMLISTNPGLDLSNETRVQRAKNDLIWAQRFTTEDWSETVKQWNAQPVFLGSQVEPVRVETPEQRRLCAEALTHWSLAKQHDFKASLTQSQQNLHWVCGALDTKYFEILESLKNLNSHAETTVVNGSGHRVLFDQPQELAKMIDVYFPRCL